MPKPKGATNPEQIRLLPLKPDKNIKKVAKSRTFTFNEASQTSHDHWPRRYRRRLTHDQQEDDDVVWYPANWQPMKSHTEVGVPLDLTGEEARKVIDLFYGWPDPDTSIYRLTITRILRLQNLGLWANYYRKREEMAKANQGKHVKELMLFHGTKTSNVDSICRKGFEVGRAGTRAGIAMGRGIYFTPDSRFSHTFTQCCKSNHAMPQIFSSPLVAAVREDPRSFDDIDYSQGWQEAHPLIKSSDFSGSQGDPFMLNNADFSVSSMEEGGVDSDEESQTSSSDFRRYFKSFKKPRTIRPKRSTSTGASTIIELAGSGYYNRLCSSKKTTVQIPVVDGTQNIGINACKHHVFASSVLIGQSTTGDQRYFMPPKVDEQNPESRRFDSCCGRWPKFTEFAVFKSEQAYPEYLIEYTHCIPQETIESFAYPICFVLLLLMLVVLILSSMCLYLLL